MKERMKKNFFSAVQLLDELAKHRDTLMYPRVIQTWEFIRKQGQGNQCQTPGVKFEE